MVNGDFAAAILVDEKVKEEYKKFKKNVYKKKIKKKGKQYL